MSSYVFSWNRHYSQLPWQLTRPPAHLSTPLFLALDSFFRHLGASDANEEHEIHIQKKGFTGNMPKRAVVHSETGRELGRGRTMRNLITVFSVTVICWLVAAGTMGCFTLIMRPKVAAPNAHLASSSSCLRVPNNAQSIFRLSLFTLTMQVKPALVSSFQPRFPAPHLAHLAFPMLSWNSSFRSSLRPTRSSHLLLASHFLASPSLGA